MSHKEFSHLLSAFLYQPIRNEDENLSPVLSTACLPTCPCYVSPEGKTTPISPRSNTLEIQNAS